MKKILKKSVNLLFNFFNVNFPVKINKRRFIIPTVGNIGLTNLFISEIWMVQILKNLININEGAYIDVGANIGQTLLKLRSVDEEMLYVGFEPNDACVFYMKRLIKKNRIKNTILLPCAISNVNELLELNFFSNEDTNSSASIIQNFRPDQKIIKKEYIACFTLAQIAKTISFPRISILKIDVEGSEKEILEQFKDLIIKDQPFIQVEILPVYNANYTDRLERQQEIEKLLKNLNYTIFRVDYDEKTKVLNGLKEIETIEIHSDLTKCEYLMSPNNQKELIVAIFKK